MFLMDVREVIIDFIQRYLNRRHSYLFSIRQLTNKFPYLDTCDFESIATNSYSKPMYHRLYNAFMLLICSRVIDGKVVDQVNSCFITCKPIGNWTQLVLVTFYYFKLFFPAALFWYKNTLYDAFAKVARQLVLERYFSLTRPDTDMTELYDLSLGWKLKSQYLGNEITGNSIYTFNVLNNSLLVNETVCNKRSKSNVVVVRYEDIEHLATTIYRNYSHLIQNRQFIVCKEKLAFTKFTGNFKLIFITPIHVKPFLACTKIEKCTPMYFLFTRNSDLVTLVRIHNAYVQQGKCNGLNILDIPNLPKSNPNIPGKSIESFMSLLSKTERLSTIALKPCKANIHKQMLKECLERTGFISIYDLKDYDTLAYVKNRVIHLTTIFQKPMHRKPFFEKKGKPLVKVEKMVKNMTMTRYKTDTSSNDTISFNINYQGPMCTMQLTLARFLNENKALGCKVLKPIWVSNVCTTLDSIHSGITNAHGYRQKILKKTSNDSTTCKMINFPATVTYVNESDQRKACSIINNRTSLNTCRLYGRELQQALEKNIYLIKTCSEIDSEVIKIVYELEKHTQELLPKNVLLMIQLQCLYKDSRSYSYIDILKFFKQKLVCSRLFMASNRAFCCSSLYCKRYKSDAIDNTSIKSSKYCNIKPPVIYNRQLLYKEFKKRYKDVGSLNTKIFKPRGRNSNLIDLLLNCKEEFFISQNCRNLLNMLLKKYQNVPNTRVEIKIIQAFLKA